MALLASHLVSTLSANQVRQLVPRCHYLVSIKKHLLLSDVSSPGVVPASYVCLCPPRVTRTRRDTYLAELNPDTGLSHWWALPQVLPRTPRLGGDRLGFY